MSPAATIVSVNVSEGGIPKRPVPEVTVTPDGIAGDAHDHEKHRTPMQALSLLDIEDLEDLRREGFDVGPGATGENLTVRGLQADGLEVGDRLMLSGGVILEVTKRRKPCYVLDAIDPVLKETIVGRCGVYAKVIRCGVVRPGELVKKEPGSFSAAEKDPGSLFGAILAGGASRRMGRPKHSVHLPDGRTMLDAVSDALGGACRDVVVVGPPGIGTIHDRRPGEGPLAGFEAILASGAAETYLVCPCDAPRLTAGLLRRLAAAEPREASCAVFRVEKEVRPRPLPMRVSAAALPEARRLLDAGERAVHALVSALGAVEVPLTEAEAELLENVNTPQDLERARHAVHTT